MNLMLVIPGMDKGGAERIASYVANALCKNGHSIVLVAYHGDGSGYSLNPLVNMISLRLSPVQMRFRIGLFIKIRRIVKKYKVQSIIAFTRGCSENIVVATLGMRVKVIVSERSNPFLNNNRVRRAITNFLFALSDEVVFTTAGCQSFYSKRVQLKSRIIPNGIELQDGQSLKKIIDRDNRMIIAVGNLRPVKDYPTMLHAFRIICDNNNECVLHIFGEGSSRYNIIRLIKELNLDGRVVFHGSVDDLEPFYNNAVCMLHTSTSESWCNSILEALSFGVPVIAANCDFGPREMIIDGYNGFLVPVKDPSMLASRLIHIIQNPELHQQMSNNAIESVRKFDLGSMVKEYEECLATHCDTVCYN